MRLENAVRIKFVRRRWVLTSICGERYLIREQHTSGNKKADEETWKATDRLQKSITQHPNRNQRQRQREQDICWKAARSFQMALERPMTLEKAGQIRLVRRR
jgi:hypothetical protein